MGGTIWIDNVVAVVRRQSASLEKVKRSDTKPGAANIFEIASNFAKLAMESFGIDPFTEYEIEETSKDFLHFFFSGPQFMPGREAASLCNIVSIAPIVRIRP